MALKNNYSGSHVRAVETINLDFLLECGRDMRLRNVEYVEENKTSNRKSVWQGENVGQYLNEDYEMPVSELNHGEVLKFKGRFVKKDYSDRDPVVGNIIEISKWYVVEKEEDEYSENLNDSSIANIYEVNYRDAVEEATKN